MIINSCVCGLVPRGLSPPAKKASFTLTNYSLRAGACLRIVFTYKREYNTTWEVLNLGVFTYHRFKEFVQCELCGSKPRFREMSRELNSLTHKCEELNLDTNMLNSIPWTITDLIRAGEPLNFATQRTHILSLYEALNALSKHLARRTAGALLHR